MSVDDISTNRHHYMSLCVFLFIYLFVIEFNMNLNVIFNKLIY